uniref:Cytochrome b5 heme-binding domain-containing protein n=1 Tax=Alexandrium catenella TaxID=2925 RepID=A0A7S1Q7I4_ALECA
MDEVRKHVSKDDAWLVLFGEAIDVTRFIPLHPGGEDMITNYLGKDATKDWQEIHTPDTLEKYMEHLTKVGKIKADAGILSWLLARFRPAGPASPQQQAEKPPAAEEEEEEEDEEGEEEKVEPVRWTEEHEAELPPGGVFDLKELSRWDGKQLPMCIGVCGVVIDVSCSQNFVPDFGYGKLWAGKDTTYAMATVSLKDYDANKFDFKLEDFSEEQFKALCGWYKHFTTKYRTVGKLKELEGWDFSSVRRAAEELPTTNFASR